jgi:hypothetical protein
MNTFLDCRNASQVMACQFGWSLRKFRRSAAENLVTEMICGENGQTTDLRLLAGIGRISTDNADGAWNPLSP